jgi:HTH-type transcriptional regulator / antitoxin HigA
MATERGRWEADWIIPPGEFLQEELEIRNMSQSELARRMGRPVKTINEIINGKAAITPETALQLELTLGISARYWTGLESTYREHLARQRSMRELEGALDWVMKFPLRELKKYELIPAEASKGDLVAAVLSFFGVASRAGWDAQWEDAVPAFRRSQVFEASPEATAAWLRWGQREATEAEVRREDAAFDPYRLREVLSKVRHLTRLGDFYQAVEQTKELLASAGVLLVVVPEFKGTRASGASYWLSSDRAVVQVSMRYKTDDQFWFTVFHELGHLLSGGRGGHIDAEPGEQAVEDDEEAANRFARNFLIPASAYGQLVTGGILSDAVVGAFAREHDVGAGIVAARLQHDGHVLRPRLDKLKIRIDWTRRAAQ